MFFCKWSFWIIFFLQIIVLDNYSANCCSGQLNFSSCSPSIELLQVVVLETLFANYTIQCLGQFICKFCKLSLRPGYFFANYRTHCSGFFLQILWIIVPNKILLQKDSRSGWSIGYFANMVIHTSESWALGSILLLDRICNSKYLTLIGSFWTPGREGGGLFFRYFSLSKETIWQFFSSLLSSQSWKRF